MSDAQRQNFDKELLQQRLEGHREYVARQWQYYGTFLILNGLLVTIIKDVGARNTSLALVLGVAFMTTSGVIFHLINWTDMRITRNAEKINALAGQEIIELPSPGQGITPWLLFSVLVFSLCWIGWLFSEWRLAGVSGCIAFALVIGNSYLTQRNWRKSNSRTKRPTS